MRPAQAFATVLARYGQEVEICRNGGQAVSCRAFVQPLLERQGTQRTPTVLGTVCRDRWLYLGDPAQGLDDLAGGWVAWKGKKLDVLRAQPIYVGGELSHWWAVLGLREESA